MICKHIKSYRSKKKEKENKEMKAPPFLVFFEKMCRIFFSVALIIYVEMNIFFHSILIKTKDNYFFFDRS